MAKGRDKGRDKGKTKAKPKAKGKKSRDPVMPVIRSAERPATPAPSPEEG